MTSPSAASPAASAPRLLWIDLLRGFLMLAIIFDHTEICFTGDNIVPYRMYVPDVLMAFFFLSGYLFYRPEGFRLRHKLHSWLRGVLMPYFIFTSALALPKAWLHGDGGSLSDLLLTILTGQGSWFIASLAVAELLFCLLLWLSRVRWRWLAGAGLFAVALAYGFGTRRLAFEANWWHVNEAVVALPSLLLGYMVHRFDSLGTRWRSAVGALLACQCPCGEFFVAFCLGRRARSSPPVSRQERALRAPPLSPLHDLAARRRAVGGADASLACRDGVLDRTPIHRLLFLQ